MSDLYFADYPRWRVIASGQQPVTAKAHRWEAVNVNGFAVFNNGRDLPRTYMVGDKDTTPIYELREQGIAYLTTIAEHKGILLAGNIGEIRQDKLDDLFRLQGVISSGAIMASQSMTTVTATGAIFTAAMVNRIIVYADGTRVRIIAYTSPTVVTVNHAHTLDQQTFELWVSGGQEGATHSGTTTASMASGDATVTASAAIFDASMVGHYVWFMNGWHRKIASFTSSTEVELEEAPTFAIPSTYFFIVDEDADYLVSATSDIFTEDMVGLKILWPDGTTRTITEYISAQSVKVDSFVRIPITVGGIEHIVIAVENPDTYAAYTEDEFINRYGFKIIWSMPDNPRRWGATQLGSIDAGSRLLVLKYPMKSLEEGQQITIQGAGVGGGFHTTTIQKVSGLNTHFWLATAANATVVDQSVMRSDAVDSIVGSFLLPGDGSSVLRIKDCRGELVAYTESQIFLGQYSGSVDAPFAFSRLNMPAGLSLYYPWTLIDVDGKYHFYAGRNAFYRFDMVSQIPERMETIEACSDLFFKAVRPALREQIFTANNQMTREVMLFFPTNGPDKGICFDYAQGTVSTTTLEYTAAGMIKRPFSNDSDDWFIAGNSAGTVLVYGKLDNVWGPWGGKRSIYYRRHANPFDASLIDFTSVLRSGLADCGDTFNEKDWLSWVLQLASQLYYTDPLEVVVNFYGARNVTEKPTLLSTQTIVLPKDEPLVPLFFTQHLFQDEIQVSGNVPCQLSSRIWEIGRLKTKSIIKRATS